jgi:competence protein ComEC
MKLLGSIPSPHLLALALCVGLGTALALQAPGPLLALATGALACAAPVAGRARFVLLAVVLITAGWWWGSLRLAALDRSVLVDEIGTAALARLEVSGPARRSEFSLAVPVRVRYFDGLPLDERARLELPPGRAPPQGAILQVVARVARPESGEDGGFDELAYLRRQGAHVVLHSERFQVLGRRRGLGGLADWFRERISTRMAPGVGGERRAVIAGVVLGDDEGLEPDLRDRFRASGLYHLLAVSGQNIAYVIGGVLLLAWALGVPRRLAQVGALAAVGGYVLAVGWQPSVVRAGIAGGLASLAWLASRPTDRWYFLLLGAAVLLAWNPYTLLDPGFQLSFTAVAAIFVVVPRLERRLEGYPLPGRLVSVLALAAGCGAATAPLAWLHFGAVPAYTVLANAFAAPVVAPLLGLALGATAVGVLLPSAAVALAWLNGYLAAYLAACARLVGGLPQAQLTSGTTLAALLLLGALVAVVLRRSPRPGRHALVLVIAFVVLAVAWHVRPRAAPRPVAGLRLTFLDVGQGDATLLQVPEGAVLVDEGPPEARVAEQLLGLGVRRLDALVMTHPSRDNIGGALEVLERLDVGLVLDPALPFENPFGKPALVQARRRGIPVRVARAGEAFRLGRLFLRVLWPAGRASPADDPNDHATVILASFGRVDALLPADAESNVTLPLALEPVEILKVGHHGSADGGLRELLELLAPDLAIVSVGKGNDYGHPTPTTLDALADAPGLELYRTDENGRIEIDTDGLRMAVRTER